MLFLLKDREGKRLAVRFEHLDREITGVAADYASAI
jgi:hypothetical protein